MRTLCEFSDVYCRNMFILISFKKLYICYLVHFTENLCDGYNYCCASTIAKYEILTFLETREIGAAEQKNSDFFQDLSANIFKLLEELSFVGDWLPNLHNIFLEQIIATVN